MAPRLALAMALSVAAPAFVSLPAHATSICRWVDDSGRTQAADAVPEKYRKVARCTESRRFEISPQAQQRAQEQAAAEAKLAAEGDKRRALAASAATRPALPTPGRRPSQTVTDATDCETWRRLYAESLACFGPYRTVGGATKAEAFEHCNAIPSPDFQCGPARQ